MNNLEIELSQQDIEQQRKSEWPGFEIFSYLNKYSKLPQPYCLVRGNIGMARWDVGTHLPITIYKYDEINAISNGPIGPFGWDEKKRLVIEFPPKKMKEYCFDVRTPYSDDQARWTGEAKSTNFRKQFSLSDGMTLVTDSINPGYNYNEEWFILEKPSKDGILHGKKGQMLMYRLCQESEVSAVIKHMYVLAYPSLAKWQRK